MKPEDVPEDWMDALISQLPYKAASEIDEIDFRAAIAAVAPLIAAAEREACARIVETRAPHAGALGRKETAAAIRSRTGDK